MQPVHAPFESQNWFVPQDVPAGLFAPSLHAGEAPHAVTPALHGAGFVVQAWPAAHVTHWPPMHTLLVSHVVPVGAAAPSAQTR